MIKKIYLVSLSVVFTGSIILLSLLGEQYLEVYLSALIIGYFAVAAVFGIRKRGITIIGVLLFLILCYLLVSKIITIPLQ
jgi:hypothetical protein